MQVLTKLPLSNCKHDDGDVREWMLDEEAYQPDGPQAGIRNAESGMIEHFSTTRANDRLGEMRRE